MFFSQKQQTKKLFFLLLLLSRVAIMFCSALVWRDFRKGILSFFFFCVCTGKVVCFLTLSGGSGQIDDHVHLPLRFQVNLCRQRKRETESKSVRNNTAEQWVQQGAFPPAQTNTPVHMEEVIIFTSNTLLPTTHIIISVNNTIFITVFIPIFNSITKHPVYSWYLSMWCYPDIDFL